MKFAITSESSIPPFEQLRRQVIDAVRSDTLAVGARLPPVRALATELGLAANTVARAYRELEQDGIIETRGRNGSFVSATGDSTHQQVQLAAVAYADRARSLGVDAGEALSIVRSALGIR